MDWMNYIEDELDGWWIDGSNSTLKDTMLDILLKIVF